MKIDVVGSKCTWVKDLSTSYIINDEILFDVPQGSFKTLLNDYDLKKIKVVIISHFHSDHFGDIHLVLDVLSRTKQKITIIAPRTCKERLIEMFKIFEVRFLESYISNYVDFIEEENNKIIKIEGYKIKCFKMEHIDVDSFGFTIEKDDKIIGFSGDTCMCNNVRKILKKSQIAFVDSSHLAVNNKHLCVGEVNLLAQEFPSCKIYAVHLSSPAEKELKENTNLYHPCQSEVVEI